MVRRALLVAVAAACVTAAPARAGVDQYPLASADRFPIGIAAGPDGAMWIAERATGDGGADHIARLTAAGAVTEFELPAGSDPAGIAAGPDGNLWFAETGADGIGRITPEGAVTHFDAPTAGAGPLEIAAGPDGALWFTEPAVDRIGRIATDGATSDFALPVAGSRPADLVAAPDGALWFTMRGSGRIGRITTAGVVSDFELASPDSEPSGIAVGADGNVWFTERAANRIGRITPAGAVADFLLPTADSVPTDVVAGPDGRVWFTEYGGNRVGRIDDNGTISEGAPLATPFSTPNRIALGPGPSLWYTLSGAAAVGRTTPEPSPLATTGEAQPLDLVSARVQGTIDPNGKPTTYSVEFGIDTTYGGRTEPGQLEAGDDPLAVSVDVKGLTPGYDYHYRVVAENANGVSRGRDRTFTLDLPTYPPPPKQAQPTLEPAPTPAPEPVLRPVRKVALKGLKAVTRYFDARGHRVPGAGLRFRLNMRAVVHVTLERRRSARPPLLLTYRGRRGLNVIRVSHRLRGRLHRGFYDATVVARARGRATKPRQVLLVVPSAAVAPS
jgi:streptogramin lyase